MYVINILHKAQILKVLPLDGALWLKCIWPLHLLYHLVYISISEHFFEVMNSGYLYRKESHALSPQSGLLVRLEKR